MTRFSALVAWRKKTLPKGLLPWELTDLLSIENVEKQGVEVPGNLHKDLVAFRHLRLDARVAAVRAVLNGTNGKPQKAKPESTPEPKKESTIIAVCGYVSQRFDSVTDARAWVKDRLERVLIPRAFVVEGKVTVLEKNYKQPLKGRNDGQETGRAANGRKLRGRPKRASPPG